MRYREKENKLKPAIPYIYLYDVAGGQTINGSYLTWDTTKIKTSCFQYTSDTNKVLLGVNVSGYYLIDFQVSLHGAASAVAYFDIYKNETIVEGSRTYISVINSGQTSWNQSGIIICPVYLEKDDYVQIKGSVQGGAPTTMANTSRLCIHRISMKGWDNSAGGLEIYSGGISR